jgi:hypothetical protein
LKPLAIHITSVRPKEIECNIGRAWTEVILYSIIAGLTLQGLARNETSVRPKEKQLSNGRKWPEVIMYSIRH